MEPTGEGGKTLTRAERQSTTPPLRGSQQDEGQARSRAGGGSFFCGTSPCRVEGALLFLAPLTKGGCLYPVRGAFPILELPPPPVHLRTSSLVHRLPLKGGVVLALSSVADDPQGDSFHERMSIEKFIFLFRGTLSTTLYAAPMEQRGARNPPHRRYASRRWATWMTSTTRASSCTS